jgi:hypothetical protein
MDEDESLLPLGFGTAVLEASRVSPQGPDGVIYEDEYVIIERKNGRVTMTGKPLRPVFIHETFQWRRPRDGKAR